MSFRGKRKREPLPFFGLPLCFLAVKSRRSVDKSQTQLGLVFLDSEYAFVRFTFLQLIWNIINTP